MHGISGHTPWMTDLSLEGRTGVCLCDPPGVPLHRLPAGRRRALIPALFCTHCRRPQDEKRLECQLSCKISGADTFCCIKMNTNIMRRRAQNSHEFLSVNGNVGFKGIVARGRRLPATSPESLCQQGHLGGRVWEAAKGSLSPKRKIQREA